MSLTFHWFLPTSGDGRAIIGRGHSIPTAGGALPVNTGPAGTAGQATGARAVSRPPCLDYLGQVARAAEQSGFTGVLTPTGTWCEDAWITTAALLGHTSRLRFLVAFRPNAISPTLAAQQAATFQRISGGRLLLNVVTGAASIAGALLAFGAVQVIPGIRPYVLALSAASLLYIAMSDLIPNLHKGEIDANALRQVLLIAAGIGTIVFFERVIG